MALLRHRPLKPLPLKALPFDHRFMLLTPMLILDAEVAQQSKARKKDDFLLAFSPVIAEATATAYKGATHEVQQKLRRVVEVWRSRNIFEIPIQEAIESRIDELDKNKANTKPGFGGHGLFSKSSGPPVPADLVPLVAPQQTITKLSTTTAAQITTANADYEKQTDPNVAPPSAPVHAARLNGLLKSLANAEGAVAESIKARTLLISGLEKLLDANRAALAKEQEQHAQLSARKSEIDAKKRDVEDAIMKGFATNSNPATPGDGSATPGTPRKDGSQSVDTERPDVEALTPPPFERLSVTPPPHQQGQDHHSMNNNKENEHQPTPAENAMQFMYAHDQSAPPPAVGHDLLATLTGAASAYGMATNGSSIGDGSASKKRKLGGFTDEIDLGSQMDGIDEDVQAMLNDGGM